MFDITPMSSQSLSTFGTAKNADDSKITETNQKLKEKNDEIKRLLRQIESKLYNKADGNWGIVGSTEHVRQLLKEVADFLR